MEQWHFIFAYHSNKSHDIMVPLVWASTVSSYMYVDIFSHLYLCLSFPNNNSHASGKRLLSNLRCIKIVTGPHSINTKSLSVLVRAMGFEYPLGTGCVI